MYEVLVPIDASMDRVDAQIGALDDLQAEGTDLSALLLHVFDENRTGASVRQVEPVRRAESELDGDGVDVTLLEDSGDPIEKILAAAQEQDVDAICLGGRKRTPAGKVLFGSVTQSVALEANVPILICGTDEKTELSE
ncbi:MAG: nucleotide-binding universal stress UspA family protein [Haloarculaceae archaeon]|jgi:nucleotide-binding universal stress UspA family protein